MSKTTLTDAAPQSVPALLARNVGRFGARVAYREKKSGVWHSWTWAEAQREIHDLAMGFLSLGVDRGDFVAVIGRNRPAHYWAMVAAQMCGAVPVPLYQDAITEEMALVLENCGARFVVCGDQKQIAKVLEIRHRIPNIRNIIHTDGPGTQAAGHCRLRALADVQAEGRTKQCQHRAELTRRIAELSYDSTCVVLYTSGTTGSPKGVVLSNRNIIETAKNSCHFDNLCENEEVLAYLPMAWVGDFIISVAQAMWAGFTVNCPQGPDTIMDDLHEISPTYFFAPPRLFEGQLVSAMTRIKDAGRLKKWLFDRYMTVARRVGPNILENKPVGLRDRLAYALGDILVYQPLKTALGFGKIRISYTAGEAIGSATFDFYRSLGVNLKQLYGQTEASVFITQQPDGQARADTVGLPSPGVEVKIAQNSEVFYRSAGAFVEYFKNPESTARTKDANGWVATGDAGFFEKSTGHLRIIDRINDVGKLADGRLFVPKFVENKLKSHPNILEAIVFGANRDHCTAFINIDLPAVRNWAGRRSIAHASYQELASHPMVYEMVRHHIAEVNKAVAADPVLAGCQIHRFLILHKELTADDGEMTRTRKVRRTVVTARFPDLIDALYTNRDSIHTETEVRYEDGRKGIINATLRLADAPVVPKQQRTGA
ncbi:AMP-binding protein [Phaeovulum sp.]|uniref:AMP-binding protein n=1 Tax=Phaeovulum sp. TaxID=2934796 RepID=UPI0039E4103B